MHVVLRASCWLAVPWALACAGSPKDQPLDRDRPNAPVRRADPETPPSDDLDDPPLLPASNDTPNAGGPPPDNAPPERLDTDDTPLDPGNPITTLRGTGPGDWGPGDYPPALRDPAYLELTDVPGQQGLARQFKVHVPPTYDPRTPTPLVFCFHGLGQNAVMFCVDGSNMISKSDAAGYLLVMPNGFENSWNAGTCCGSASTRELDDVALVRAILEDVGTHLNVDLDRVYATGFSNGGYMSLRLACEAADSLAAVAPASAGIGTNDLGGGTNPNSDFLTCQPSAPVSVLAFHGTEDTLVSYAQHQPSLEHLATAHGCSTTTAPAATPASDGDTACSTYQGCPPGVEVTGCTVTGGGHVWFGDPTCGTGAGALGCLIVGQNSTSLTNTDAAWEFFARVGASR